MMGSLVLCITLALLQVGHVFGNKNVPTFDDYSALDSRYLNEDFPLGDSLGQIKAHDPDGTSVEYEILGEGAEYFEIGLTTGVVILKKFLDFELETEIRMIIQVKDEDGQISVEEGKVFVQDVNDIEPEFDRYDIDAHLSEDLPVGTVVANISLTDEDETNSIITVVCEDDTEALADACNKFGLQFKKSDISNKYWRGQLYLKNSLDYEQRISYIVMLIANDGLLNKTNEIHIEVDDINDSPPVWTRIKPVEINEENKVGTYITTVTARDGDITDPRRINYEIIEGGDEFSIEAATGRISNKVLIDYDSVDHSKGVAFEVKVKAMEVISTSPLVTGNDAETTSTAVFTISVKDIDDNTPEFDKSTYTALIPENIVTGANIPGLQMTITDIDSGTYNSFDLVTLDHTDIFSIIPDNGKGNAGATLFIKDSTTIDYEQGPREYIIKVEARENKVIPALTGSATVSIKVTDINDQTPQFRQETYFKTISETSDPGFVVIDLDAFDTEAGSLGEAGIRYKLFANQLKHFKIDEVSGVITVAECNAPLKPGTFPCIDYERKKQYILTVSATDNLGQVDKGRTRSVQVIVSITDENDNVPKPADKYTAYIYEEQTNPVQPLVIKAVDPDTVGGPVTYELSGPTDVISLWKITESTDSFGDRIGTITARRPVLLSDAQDESTGRVSFQVLSKDAKDTVSSDVTITIIDINNNVPQFARPTYVHEIREDTKGEVFVITVNATDGDAPTSGNGLIDFRISTGARGKFRVKATRREGDTFLADIYTTPDATFNYDLTKLYEMELQARDQGTPKSLIGGADLIINIIDTNNNAPVITPSTVSIAVPENKPKNTKVHEVVAIDLDKTRDLRYYIIPTTAQTPTGSIVDKNDYNYEELFRIEEETGIVRVNKALNRELTSFIFNTLKVVDIAGNPPQTGTGALFIRITEVNDQDPEFDLPLYNITMNEELNINYFVRNLHCTDEDDAIAGFELEQTVPRSPNYFSLEDSSGALIVADRIDFEKLEEIRMVATCFDAGTPRRSGTTQIIINVRNVNDNSPEFKEPIYKGQISETKLGEDIGGMSITVVSATDIDKGDFGIVRYKMADPAQPFLIDPITGNITIKHGVMFDRENSSSFGFQVIAFDSPNTPEKRKETRVPVYLTILDINDNCPVFDNIFYEGSIPENAKSGTDIIDIFAKDADIGINKQLKFTVQDGSFIPSGGTDYFGISPKSGRIFSETSLSGKSGNYRFNITATDTEGSLPAIMCSSHVMVEIEVLQSENYAPNWIRPPGKDFVIYILESQYEGMLVYDCKAEDLDPGPSGIVDYFFVVISGEVAATAEFRINQVTGVIRAEIEFDREQVDTYFLTLQAQDQGPTKATSLTTLTVVIMDVDDNDPVFVMKDGQVEPLVLPKDGEEALKEDKDIPVGGLLLGKCTATDADSDHDNNKIYYEIITADDKIKEMITVDRDTCEIRLMKTVDFEVTPRLEFGVFAFNERNDDSVKRHKREANPSILPVVIQVTDSNDNAPEFTQSSYYACAPLDSPFQSSIVDLDAHDAEQSDEELTYFAEETLEFEIDQQGIVRNIISFPSSSARVFAFKVFANDTERLGSARVNVFVTSDSTQVVLQVNRPSSDVRRVQKEYEELLIGLDDDIRHACVDIRNHITDEGKISPTKSDIYVSVVGWNSIASRYQLWSSSRLYNLINDRRDDDSQVYDTMFITDISEVEDDKFDLDEDVVLAILIVSILLIAFAILLFILACYCIWAKKKKKIRKIKAQRLTVVQASPDTPQHQNFENPVYHNSGYVSYEEEYSTVSRSKKEAGPIAPVIIPAPQNLQPLTTFQSPSSLEPENPEEVEPIAPELPEPFIETEVLPEEEPPRVMEPDYEDRIETVVVDDDDNNDDDDDDLPLPEPPTDMDNEIDTEIRDETPPPIPEPPEEPAVGLY